MEENKDLKSDLKTFTSDYIIESDEDLSMAKSHDEFPDSFEGFRYKFNEFGQLRHIDSGEPFEFNAKKDDHVYNQKRYEAIGDLVTGYVYGLLEKECGLKKMTVPLDNAEGEPSTFIFHSDDAFSNNRLVVLIHGSGVVRAGQWSRRLIINDSLNSGTQMPFIKRARGLGYGIIVLNSNDNKREIDGVAIKIRGNDKAESHANYVWKNIIMPKVVAEHIAIVAHSYGGIVTVNMCLSFPESFQKRVFAIAFTDSPHSLVNQGLFPPLISYFRRVARNWVISNLPLDSPLRIPDTTEVDCYSAGTQRHDLTSWMSFASIYEFIDSKYRKQMYEEL